MKTHKSALIAGAGYLGGFLSKLLLDEGWSVHTINRTKRNFKNIKEKLSAVEHLADLSDKDSLLSLENKLKKEAFDFVYFFASPDSRNKEAYESIFINGLSNILNLDIHKQTKRIFFSSSTAVYSQNDGSLVNENSEVSSCKFNAEVLLQAENILKESKHSSTSLRLSGLYGPGRRRIIENAISLTKPEDIKLPFGYTNRINAIDGARAALHLSKLEDVEPLYLVSDEKPTLRYEVLNWFRKELKLDELELSKEKLEKYHTEKGYSGKQVSSSKLKQTGFSFEYPSFKEGYKEELKN